MSENGYYNFPRSLSRNPLWKDLPPSYKEVFNVILDHVCYKPRKFDDHGHLIELKPGQICISERDLLKLCGKYITRNDIQRSIVKFILYGFLSQEVRHKKSILTIKHRETYELICKNIEPRSEPNLSQTRAKLEPEKNKDKKDNKEKKVIEDIAQLDRQKEIQSGIFPSEHNIYNRTQPASPLRLKNSEIFFSFDLRSFQNISEQDLKGWTEVYPAIDIRQQLLKMVEWCLSNPTKSKKQWRKFITGWLSRSNEEEINKKAYRSRANGKTFGVVEDRRVKNPDGTPIENDLIGTF